MRREKTIDIIFVCCIFLFLTTATYVTAFGNQDAQSFFENRNLASWPEFSVEAIYSGDYFAEIENYLTDHMARRITMTKFSTAIDLALRRPVVNGIVVTDKVLLPWNRYDAVDENSISKKVEVITANLKSVSNLVENYGGYFCYIAVPAQYILFENEYPDYLNDKSEYAKVSSSTLFSALNDADINYLDMLTVIDSPANRNEMGSPVDHHYNMVGAYATYRSFMEKLNETTEYNLDILIENDFSFETLPNSYLGSRSRKLFGLAKVHDSLSYIVPKNAVAFTRSDRGSVSNPSLYSMPATDDEWVSYSFYMGGDIAHTVIDTDRDDLPSILVYGDSFTNAFETVVYYSFNQMYSLDLRHYDEMSLGEFIKLYKPDVVICLRDYQALLLTTGNGQGTE